MKNLALILIKRSTPDLLAVAREQHSKRDPQLAVCLLHRSIENRVNTQLFSDFPRLLLDIGIAIHRVYRDDPNLIDLAQTRYQRVCKT